MTFGRHLIACFKPSHTGRKRRYSFPSLTRALDQRKSLVVKTTSSHYIITPDNGTLTHVAQDIGIVEARYLDETINRLPKSGKSHTFHGRDIYAYTGRELHQV